MPSTPERGARFEAPAVERVVLLLADIGGYTNFLRMPRISLLHAQTLIDLLLQAVVRTPGVPLERARATGDLGLFFCRPDTLTARRAVLDSVPRLLESFVLGLGDPGSGLATSATGTRNGRSSWPTTARSRTAASSST